MKLIDIRLGVSPLTDCVMMGTIVNDRQWKEKRDATSDFCGALLTWIEPGTTRTIRSSTGETFEVEVRKIITRATEDEGRK